MPDVMNEVLMREILVEDFRFSNPTELQKSALNLCPYDGGAREWIMGDTSSGKTIVPLAAFYASRLKYGEKRKLLFLVPYRALASQKARELRNLFPDMDILVSTSERCTDDGRISCGNCDVAIVVYEKAFLFETSAGEFLRQYSHIVFDEIGIVESGERGLKADYLLHYACQRKRGNIFVLAALYCDWGAYMSCYGFDVRGKATMRPVPIESKAVDLSAKPETLVRQTGIRVSVLDELVRLCREHLNQKHKILIFAPDKNMVRQLAKKLNEELYGGRWQQKEFSPDQGRERLYQKLDMLPEDIQSVFGDDDDIYAYYNGIAFHHAAMPEALREIIEDAYLEADELNIVCATETLAFGLNSKVDVVVIAKMDKYDNNQHRFIMVNEYQNYIGRAGRLGARERGYAYTLLTGQEIDGVRDIERWKTLDRHEELSDIKSQMRDLHSRPDMMLMLLHYFDRGQESSADSLHRKILTYPNADEIVRLPNLLERELAELESRNLIRSSESGGKSVYSLTIWGESILGYVFSRETYDWLADLGERLILREKMKQEGKSVPIKTRVFEPDLSFYNGLDTSPLRFLYESCGNSELFKEFNRPFRQKPDNLRYLKKNAEALRRLLQKEREMGRFTHNELKEANKILCLPFESGSADQSLAWTEKQEKREQETIEKLREIWPLFQRYMLSYALLLWLNSVNLQDIRKRSGFLLNTLNIVILKIEYMMDALLHRFAGKLPPESEEMIRLTQTSLQYGVRRDVLTELHERGIIEDFSQIGSVDGRRLRVLAQIFGMFEAGKNPAKVSRLVKDCKRFGDAYYKYIAEKCGGGV